MKKLSKLILFIIIISSLICLVQKLGILDFCFYKITQEDISNYSAYYFNQLNEEEKSIYIKIDKAVQNLKEKVFLGPQEQENINLKMEKILTAYFYDNPEEYYVSNEYAIITRDFKVFDYVILNLKYITEDKYEIEAGKKLLDEAIDNMLKTHIKQGMTGFEKEVAIHDALVQHVDYYVYKDINSIPAIKHTAYGALIDKEAVCDGYAKAFKLLLEQCGITNVIISGKTENENHAWNLVELGGKYYHVDVTSDKLNDNGKHVIHTYFNLTDKQIQQTHIVDDIFVIPIANEEKYNYYNKTGNYVSYEDNLYSKLSKIISVQAKASVLEIKVDKRYYLQSIVDTLYDLDFNNWRSNKRTNITYSKMNDVYIFIK